MKKVYKSTMHFLFFAIISASTVSVPAQEFRGFYSGNSTTNYSATAPRYNKSVYSRHYRNQLANSPSDSYRGNPANNAGGLLIQPFQGFYATPYPSSTININILPAGARPANGGYNYYNKVDYNEGDYNNSGRLDNGSTMIEINGQLFYEYEGNYYMADNTRNLGNKNNRLGWNNTTTRNRMDRYYDHDEITYVADRNRSNNVTYISGKKQLGKITGANNGYEGENLEYTNTNQVRGPLLLSQNEQEALIAENKRLRQAQQQQLAKEKEMIVAERKRQIQENKQIEQDLNDSRKRNFKEIEQARQDQEIRTNKQQDADKEYEKRRLESQRNNATNNELSSNLKIGDAVNQIPKNSKEVKIDGKKTYVSPQNIYYRKQQGKYRVVGMQ